MLQVESGVKSKSVAPSKSRKASWFKWARSQSFARPADRQVLLYIIERSRAATGTCYPGQKLIAADLGYCERTIRYSVRRLVKAGLLEAIHRYSRSGKRTSNLYRVAHPDVTVSGPLERTVKPAPAPDPTRGKICRVVITEDSNRISAPTKEDTVVVGNSARPRVPAREAAPVRVPERLLGGLALGMRRLPWDRPRETVRGFVPDRIDFGTPMWVDPGSVSADGLKPGGSGRRKRGHRRDALSAGDPIDLHDIGLLDPWMFDIGGRS